MLRRALRRERASTEGKDPPRRSGEGPPLRAFGPGRGVQSAVFVDGGTGRRCPRGAGNRCRQGQHRAAEAMTVTAVQVHGAGCLVAAGVGFDLGICRDSGMGVGAGLVLVLVVTQVPRSSVGLVSAVGCHGRPAELERQQHEQDDGEEATHGQESSGYRVCPGKTQPTRLWGFTTLRRGCARRFGSSHGG